jgi:tRNA (adenine37-N6)-methyltransferase
MEIRLLPVATIKNSRTSTDDDFWGDIVSEIELCENIPAEAFDGIEGFSHLEIMYYFDRVKDEDIVFSGRPRGNPEYPRVGIFVQRKKDRPNKIGLCRVRLIEHKDRRLLVKNLDAINGTPVLDIKPVYREFQSGEEVLQPEWVSELMKNYWKQK